MPATSQSKLWGRVRCSSCQHLVDVVDGEYARHYIRNEICVLSLRRIEFRTHIIHRGVRLRIPQRASSWAGRTGR